MKPYSLIKCLMVLALFFVGAQVSANESSRGMLTTDKFNMAELSQNLTSLHFGCEKNNAALKQKNCRFSANHANTTTVHDHPINLKDFGSYYGFSSTKITRALTTKVAKNTAGFLGKNYGRCASGIGNCVIVET